MGRIWSSIVACTVSVCGVAFSTAPVVAQNDGFIFSGDKAVSARDPRQFKRQGTSPFPAGNSWIFCARCRRRSQYR